MLQCDEIRFDARLEVCVEEVEFDYVDFKVEECFVEGFVQEGALGGFQTALDCKIEVRGGFDVPAVSAGAEGPDCRGWQVSLEDPGEDMPLAFGDVEAIGQGNLGYGGHGVVLRAVS